MKRGDLVTVVLPGAYGKPRPAVIVQSDTFEKMESITFLPLTGEILPKQVFRVTVSPTATNGLQAQSQVMADKCSTLPSAKVGAVFGRLDDDDMSAVHRALALYLNFA
jgi:mRNA interferase MazF